MALLKMKGSHPNIFPEIMFLHMHVIKKLVVARCKKAGCTYLIVHFFITTTNLHYAQTTSKMISLWQTLINNVAIALPNTSVFLYLMLNIHMSK